MYQDAKEQLQTLGALAAHRIDIAERQEHNL
jgi:hypothetical protein